MPKIARVRAKKADDELSRMRHSAAHVLAMAVLKHFPGTKLAIGPAIEEGFYYDFDFVNPISEADLPRIEQTMREIIKKDVKFVQKEIRRAEAEKILKDQPYKLELLRDIPDEPVSFYESGDFSDLCKGPHLASTGKIGSVKLLSVAGAYWRGSEKNKMLTRIYGTAFPTTSGLGDYLELLKERELRDHRKIGHDLDLFTISDEVGPGLVLWTPKGTILREELEKLGKETEDKWGYERVATPHIAKEELYKKSGHLPYYKDSMYPPMHLDDGDYYLKAMNCPHTHMIFKRKKWSYRGLPVRYAEFGTVYRYELSGTLAGLLRVRGFTQNDAHIYCREDQIEQEFLDVMRMHEYYYKLFGIKDYYIRLSLHDPKNRAKYIDEPAMWKFSEDAIKRALKRSKIPFVEAVGEAAFYGPKVDFQIKSVVGREESASTNQLDFSVYKRFGLTYTDKDGQEKPVFVIHRAPLGSHERFIAFLIEHFAGAFPVWLSPVQAVVIPVADRHMKYAKQVTEELKRANIRVELDESSDTVNKKIRNAEIQKVPYALVVGDREHKSKSVAVRDRSGKVITQKLTAFSKKVSEEIASKK